MRGSRSMRAAISAWSVSGIRFDEVAAARAACGSSPRRRAGCPRSCRAASPPDGRQLAVGEQRVDELLALLAARAARARSRSRARGRRPSPGGRRAAPAARGRGSAAAPRAPRSARCSISSSSGSSAQWMSSKTSTSGCASASSLGPLARGPGDLLLAALGLDRLEHADGERRAGRRRPRPRSDARSFSIASSTRVVVRDPGRDLDHLGERPVGDALAVGQAAAGEDRRALDAREELAREPALADAGLAVDREQVRAPVADGALERVLEQLELGLAADERRGDRRRAAVAVAERDDAATRAAARRSRAARSGPTPRSRSRRA